MSLSARRLSSWEQAYLPMIYGGAPAGTETLQALAIGLRRSDQRAGPVEYAAVDVASGQRGSVADYRGSPVLLTSWATWCIECRHELPGLSKLWEAEKGNGLVVVAVNLDGPGQSRGLSAMIEGYSLTMPVWRDSANAYSATFRALGIPTSVLVDLQCRVAKVWPGSVDFQDPQVRAVIEAVLEKPD